MASPAPGPSQFRNRFGFLLGALAGVFIAVALVAVIVVADNGGGAAANEGLADNWSRWQPQDTSVEGGSQEIAAHVSAEYKHPDGQQLVDIAATELPDDVKLTIRSGTINNIDGTRVLYTMDGLGTNPPRSIKGGTPSATRLKVIHREALELALYTFRYLPDAESVMLLLPPPPATAADQAATLSGASTATDTPLSAIFYRPGDLKQQLQMPLGNTLAHKVPSTNAFTGPEATNVETLTLSNRFIASSTATGILLDRP
jgi:hypothetical protein